jgi:transcriptional regulator with XRE-family HTH domain
MIRERILEFLKSENKTSAQFAEEIGVQPSGISHILSGRNNPSLDFVVKMLEKYSFISSEWLLFGKGSMYKGTFSPDLFSSVEPVDNEKSSITNIKSEKNTKPESLSERDISDVNVSISEKTRSGVAKIVWFFDDGSFLEYYPRKD